MQLNRRLKCKGSLASLVAGSLLIGCVAASTQDKISTDPRALALVYCAAATSAIQKALQFHNLGILPVGVEDDVDRLIRISADCGNDRPPDQTTFEDLILLTNRILLELADVGGTNV